MGWHFGRYYVRKFKRGNKIVSEYIGGGERGRAKAGIDAQRRAERQADADAWRAEKARWEGLNALLDDLCDASDLLVKASLLAAGYHQHDRGEWRRRRGPRNQSPNIEPTGDSTGARGKATARSPEARPEER